MSWETDASTAYANELAAAERHMEGCPRDGGKCWECDHFHEVQASDELPKALARMLDFCGACVVDGCVTIVDGCVTIVDGCVTIVDRSEWHSADECWEVH